MSLDSNSKIKVIESHMFELKVKGNKYRFKVLDKINLDKQNNG